MKLIKAALRIIRTLRLAMIPHSITLLLEGQG
jgi:hypothetical protein